MQLKLACYVVCVLVTAAASAHAHMHDHHHRHAQHHSAAALARGVAMCEQHVRAVAAELHVPAPEYGLFGEVATIPETARSQMGFSIADEAAQRWAGLTTSPAPQTLAATGNARLVSHEYAQGSLSDAECAASDTVVGSRLLSTGSDSVRVCACLGSSSSATSHEAQACPACPANSQQICGACGTCACACASGFLPTSDGLCVSAYQEEEERPQEMVDELAPTPVQEDLEKRGLIGGLVCGLGILCPSPRARARARLRRDEHSAVHVEDDRDEQSLAEGEADDLDLLLNVPEQEQPHEEEETAEQKEHMKNLQVTRAILAERARDKRERKRAAAEARAAKAAKLRYGSVALAPLPGACEAHETMCDAGPWAIAPTVCVDAQTDLENCGACSNDCTQIAGAVGVECVLGGCRISSCSYGYKLVANSCVRIEHVQHSRRSHSGSRRHHQHNKRQYYVAAAATSVHIGNGLDGQPTAAPAASRVSRSLDDGDLADESASMAPVMMHDWWHEHAKAHEAHQRRRPQHRPVHPHRRHHKHLDI